MHDYVVLVDENNTPLGTMDKLEAHSHDTPLHRAFSVFLFNEKKELLLQQRSSKKKTWPNVWSNSCCGHQKLNEEPLYTAKQRIAFELGIANIQLSLILPDYRYRFEKDGIVENEICPVMVGVSTNEPRINTDETQAIRWIAWETWLDEIQKHAEHYSPWCVEETQLLNHEQIFQSFLSSLPL